MTWERSTGSQSQLYGSQAGPLGPGPLSPRWAIQEVASASLPSARSRKSPCRPRHAPPPQTQRPRHALKKCPNSRRTSACTSPSQWRCRGHLERWARRRRSGRRPGRCSAEELGQGCYEQPRPSKLGVDRGCSQCGWPRLLGGGWKRHGTPHVRNAGSAATGNRRGFACCRGRRHFCRLG